MNEPTPNADPKNRGRAIYEEADIGSGERPPGQHETDEMIREIPPLPPSRQADEAENVAESQPNKQGDAGAAPDAKRQEDKR